MCGIAGFVGTGDAQALERMERVIAYRGPDDSGIWLEGEVGLAHRRLSIVDLSPKGHQPMHSENAVITFNGEIYNFRELRKELEGKGRVFTSESDTEVILELYELFGKESFARLQGMFAFALYDKRKRALYLVRDRMGEKPLFYAHQNGAFVFASEPKALFAHGSIQKELDASAVSSYLTYDAVLTPQSIFAGVSKVPAASFLEYKEGNIKIDSYWQLPKTISSELSFADASAGLDALFEKSVSSQMLADVPVGVFLSGGLDSSLIAYYAQHTRQEPIHTFSLGFDDPSYDESSYAKQVAEALGTKHFEQRVSAQDLRDTLAVVSSKLDEPIADSAILPNYLLAKFAREHVTVALGGDGGDELFAGYQTFTAEKYLRWYRTLPHGIREHLVKRVVEALPVSHRYFSLDFKAKQFLRGADMPERYIHQAWLSSFNPEEEKVLLTPRYQHALPSNAYERIDEYLEEIGKADAHLAATYFYLRTYMQDDILAKVDRSSMFCSLEVRAPFLDKSVVEYAAALPWHYKHRGLKGKYILRKLMEGRLPNEIINRKKHGFGVPVGSWFKEEWRDFLHETLSRERVEKAGVFNPEEVEKLIAEHQSGARNHRKKLWSLLVFQLWYDTWAQ